MTPMVAVRETLIADLRLLADELERNPERVAAVALAVVSVGSHTTRNIYRMRPGPNPFLLVALLFSMAVEAEREANAGSVDLAARPAIANREDMT